MYQLHEKDNTHWRQNRNSTGFLIWPLVIYWGMALMLGGCSVSEWNFVFLGEKVRDHVTLVEALRSKGYHVTPIGTVIETSVPVAGHMLQVNEWPIHTYQFEGGEEAERYSTTVDSRAREGATKSSPSPIHKFRKGNFMVLYEGPESSLKDMLNQLMSPPGRRVSTILKVYHVV